MVRVRTLTDEERRRNKCAYNNRLRIRKKLNWLTEIQKKNLQAKVLIKESVKAAKYSIRNTDRKIKDRDRKREKKRCLAEKATFELKRLELLTKYVYKYY